MTIPLRNKTTAVVAVALMSVSCSIGGHHGNGDDNFYSAFTTFPGAEWQYAAPQDFVVDTLRDSVCPSGTLLLTLRHTEAYEYSNIWLEITYDADDSTAVADTVNIILADSFGHWRGRGSGASFQVTDTLRRRMPLRRQQRIALRHIMRVDTLQNIEQAGITYLPDM